MTLSSEERNTLDLLDDDHLKQEYEAGLASGEPVVGNILQLLTGFKVAWDARAFREKVEKNQS
jgi:hypothetical protein